MKLAENALLLVLCDGFYAKNPRYTEDFYHEQLSANMSETLRALAGKNAIQIACTVKKRFGYKIPLDTPLRDLCS